MSNSTWTIFPEILSSRLIDVLKAENICDQNNGQIYKLLTRHLFSQSIQLVSQNRQIFDMVHDYMIQSNELAFLMLRDMPVYALICPYFLDAYNRKGTLYGVSVNRDVNVENTVSLLPNQILLLSLNAQTYYKLGIIGHKSTLNNKKNLVEKYRIEIELGKDCFKPNKKNYQRVYECLKRTRLKCDFMIKWNPHDKQISPNSLQQYFNYVQENCRDDELLSKMTIHNCYPTVRTYTNNSAVIFSQNSKDKDLEETLNNFIEWASAQVAEIKLENTDSDNLLRSDIYCAEIRGFFTSSNISQLLTALKGNFSIEELGAIVVNGFENSPQCWSGRNNEHYKDVSGENMFGIGQFDKKVMSWSICDQFDFGIEKL